jgi:hypothetical protein
LLSKEAQVTADTEAAEAGVGSRMALVAAVVAAAMVVEAEAEAEVLKPSACDWSDESWHVA